MALIFVAQFTHAGRPPYLQIYDSVPCLTQLEDDFFERTGVRIDHEEFKTMYEDDEHVCPQGYTFSIFSEELRRGRPSQVCFGQIKVGEYFATENCTRPACKVITVGEGHGNAVMMDTNIVVNFHEQCMVDRIGYRLAMELRNEQMSKM